MNQQYTKEFREQALRKVLERGSRPLGSVADDLQIKLATLKHWIKQTRQDARQASSSPPTRTDSSAERLALLLASASLSDEALQAWCRERGIYAYQLEAWKVAFVQSADASAIMPIRNERDAFKAERDRLQRELIRKDKALAEAAALLVLSKKFQALLAGEVE